MACINCSGIKDDALCSMLRGVVDGVEMLRKKSKDLMRRKELLTLRGEAVKAAQRELDRDRIKIEGQLERIKDKIAKECSEMCLALGGIQKMRKIASEDVPQMIKEERVIDCS